jgi:hypothetical protein
LCSLFNDSLIDVINYNNKLYLVFEFLDRDLKRYIDTTVDNNTPISPMLVKVSITFSLPYSSRAHRRVNVQHHSFSLAIFNLMTDMK